jgi:hypothetical protein
LRRAAVVVDDALGQAQRDALRLGALDDRAHGGAGGERQRGAIERAVAGALPRVGGETGWSARLRELEQVGGEVVGRDGRTRSGKVVAGGAVGTQRPVARRGRAIGVAVDAVLQRERDVLRTGTCRGHCRIGHPFRDRAVEPGA